MEEWFRRRAEGFEVVKQFAETEGRVHRRDFPTTHTAQLVLEDDSNHDCLPDYFPPLTMRMTQRTPTTMTKMTTAAATAVVIALVSGVSRSAGVQVMFVPS